MDVREKLVELIAKAKAMYADDYTDHTEDEYIAETLLDNFVTVLDGKPLEAFLHPIDAYKGLKAKYLVFKADTGEKVDNCFILRPDKDHSAVEALRAYAKATDNEILAGDIFNWVGKGVTVQEWVSVDERLPENFISVLGYMTDAGEFPPVRECYTVGNVFFFPALGDIHPVSHWREMPQPPKGE